MPFDIISQAQMRERMPYSTAVGALEEALLSGLDPEKDKPRIFSPLDEREFILMPSEYASSIGIKILTVSPNNTRKNLPKIQGIYALFDSESGTPTALMDGAELTLIRTPAVTALAIKHILASFVRSDVRRRPLRAVVFGTGPQAIRHIEATASVVGLEQFSIVGRSLGSASRISEECQRLGYDACAGDVSDVSSADVVICATSSATPLFSPDLVKPETVVAAVGAHNLKAREVPPELARRSHVVVEARRAAMSESGDLIPARSVEEWQRQKITNLAELVRGEFSPTLGQPVLFSGVGMSWEDVVIANALVAAKV